MNSTTTISEPRRRTAWVGLWLIGAIALGGLTGFDQPLIGAGIYAIVALTAVTLWGRYPGTLFDERDAGIHRQASGYTIGVLAIISAIVFPLLTALYGLGCLIGVLGRQQVHSLPRGVSQSTHSRPLFSRINIEK